MPRHTPLHAVHTRLKGRLIHFAGWEMPVQYAGVRREHHAVRTAVGLFDVSHMGEVEFCGPGALEEVNRLISNDLQHIEDGQACYAGVLNETGGFVDDVVVYRFNPQHILLCVNAANREKDFAWLYAHARHVKPVDRSEAFAQLALQGPKACSVLQRLTNTPLAAIGGYRFTLGSVVGVHCLISRTGYTGEDGFELYCAPTGAEFLYLALLEEGAAAGLMPCGLGARDSLRIEMKYPLYGNDIDEAHTPLEAALGWIVKASKPDFIGKAALEKQQAEGVARKLVGFVLTEAGIPRAHYPIVRDAQQVGSVTSGTFGPSLEQGIGLGYVPSALAEAGTTFHVDIRGRLIPARVVKTPFYVRPAQGL